MMGLWTFLFSGIFFFTQDKVRWKDLFTKPIEQSVFTIAPVQTVTLADALTSYYESNTLFLDVRMAKYYNYGHIKNALNLPPNSAQDPDGKIIEKLKAASKVIIYCNGVGCGSAFNAARSLQKLGLNNTLVYSEGWPEWRICRLPIDASQELKKELQKEWK